MNTHADSKEISDYVDGIVGVFSAKNGIGEMDKEAIHFLESMTVNSSALFK